jgi:ABC-type spermidine/putrescine transport system permease subunit II
MARPREFDRPRFLWVFGALAMGLMLLPLAFVVLYSFNSGESLVRFAGFSTRWYREALTDADWHASLRTSIEIALVTTLACAVTGPLLALGLVRASRRVARPTDATILLRLVSPETVTAVASLLLFTKLGVTLSNTTIILAHIAVCLPFVTVVVRSRLVSLNPEVEESAMDLGATRLGALRLVVLPLIWPSIAASSLLCFVLSFDDFVTSVFTSGIGTSPLPVRIYSLLRFGVTPVVNAIGVLMFVLALILLAGAALLLRAAQGRGQVVPQAAADA